MKNTSELQKLLHTIGDTNRLRIIACIGDNESSVGAIVEATSLSQPLVSHHLKILKGCGLLDTRRQGPFIYYRLAFPELLDLLGVLNEIAQNVDDAEPSQPMFQCPAWWEQMKHGLRTIKEE